MCECELRIWALEMAVDWAGEDLASDDVVKAAGKFFDFLNKCDCEAIPEGEVN